MNLLKTFYTEDKCHLIANKNELTEIQIDAFSIKNSGTESNQMLTMIANFTLILMLTIYAVKQTKKIRSLARVTPYMALVKKKIDMNSTFPSCKNNNKIKHLQEQC